MTVCRALELLAANPESHEGAEFKELVLSILIHKGSGVARRGQIQEKGFFWECAPFTKATCDSSPFRMSIISSSAFNNMDEDRHAFARHFAANPHATVIHFSNLGRDAELVVPVPLASRDTPRTRLPPLEYTHAGTFFADWRACLPAPAGYSSDGSRDDDGELVLSACRERHEQQLGVLRMAAEQALARAQSQQAVCLSTSGCVAITGCVGCLSCFVCLFVRLFVCSFVFQQCL